MPRGGPGSGWCEIVQLAPGIRVPWHLGGFGVQRVRTHVHARLHVTADSGGGMKWIVRRG